jgi:hypothetical protein
MANAASYVPFPISIHLTFPLLRSLAPFSPHLPININPAIAKLQCPTNATDAPDAPDAPDAQTKVQQLQQ